MAVIVETGGGVRAANSYVSVGEVTAYLTERNRQAENSWSTATQAAQEAAVIAATDYIDRHVGPKFKGRREFEFDGVQASGVIALDALPVDGDTVTVAHVTLTFRSSPNSLEVQIGADADESATNLAAALESQLSGHTSSATTNEVTVTVDAAGRAGNFTELSTTGANITLTAFSGGLDEGDQPLEFPRTGLTRRDGRLVTGIPRQLRHAASELAVRAVAGTALETDPTVPVAGQGPITEERTRVEGAIDTTVKYAAPNQSQGVLPAEAYPAAINLLADFVVSSSVFGRVYRV